MFKNTFFVVKLSLLLYECHTEEASENRNMADKSLVMDSEHLKEMEPPCCCRLDFPHSVCQCFLYGSGQNDQRNGCNDAEYACTFPYSEGFTEYKCTDAYGGDRFHGSQYGGQRTTYAADSQNEGDI